jgi:hypothetical protein
VLYWKQVWRRVHELAGVHVEKRAVMELISHAEQHMDMVILQSKRELEKRNELCGIQGIRPRARIDGECVRQAIKSINDNGHSSSSERTGGKPREAKFETHSQEDTEVA